MNVCQLSCGADSVVAACKPDAEGERNIFAWGGAGVSGTIGLGKEAMQELADREVSSDDDSSTDGDTTSSDEDEQETNAGAGAKRDDPEKSKKARSTHGGIA